MLKEDAQAFNKDDRFQKAVDEALRTKRSVELAAMMEPAAMELGAIKLAAMESW